MTWNIEGIKAHQYFLSEALLSQLPDLVFLSEPQAFQCDMGYAMKTVSHEYCHWLNSEDLYDQELSLVKSKAKGGTLVMWRKWLDPHISVHPVQSPAFLPLILQLPGAQTSAHIAVYLPTSGKDYEFISELANLKNCIEDIQEKYGDPVLFIRGDGNSNPKNVSRFSLLTRFIQEYSLIQVNIGHPTYHHFVGQGKFDSNIDMILHSTHGRVSETITQIDCKFDNPEIASHHDVIFSEFTLPRQDLPQISDDLIAAPRTVIPRSKILWNEEGIDAYRELVSTQLQQVRQTWLDPSSKGLTSVLLQSTNLVMTMAAAATNPSVSLNDKKTAKPQKIPRKIIRAKRNLHNKHKNMQRRPNAGTKRRLEQARKHYKQTVRNTRLQQSLKRDQMCDTILTDNPGQLHRYLRSCKKTRAGKIEKLSVGNKLYCGGSVGDGFFDSMSSLKSCEMESLVKDPVLTDHFSNYENILKICQTNRNIPEISFQTAADILKRMKKHVIDIYSISALHYCNAGDEGLVHFASLINSAISDVNNATIEELNLALGLILYKGHRKDKNSDRSYRTISTCPFIAKAIDLYLRDLYQDSWDACTASTQYQTSGSSHELASLLVTEVIQYSLNIADQPVYLLVLDAQSAYDRCLRQILCTELFKSGMTGSALLLINNRLENRSTVYQWDGEMLGPARDKTGFEQGGINSGDFYKLYNNSQLKRAQSSSLGVNIGSSVVSAIGQADDVMLVANNVDCLRLLAMLTESYCASYRVKLVATKTKLLPMSHPRHAHLVDYAKLTNPVTIDGTGVKFVEEAEHVGVLRSTAGNMPHILQRIASHKNDLSAVCSAGMARGHRGNPAASLRVHQLHATPVLLSGMASLVLSKAETKVIDTHYKCTVQRLQRLHTNTPRAVVFFMAGCLPGEAVLNLRQLGLFSMVCHLHGDPLNLHAKYILTSAPPSAKSWFQQIRVLCSQYGLPDPLQLLNNPPPKEAFKREVKLKIIGYWEALLRMEASPLGSLQYFKPELYSLTKPHYIWTCAASNPFECSKSTVLAKMMSGRFRTEMLSRHWSANKAGYCRAPGCQQIPGTLEHLLVICPDLDPVRERLYTMWLERTVMFPALHSIIRDVLGSDENLKVQFILEPLAFPLLLNCFKFYGQRFIDQLSYITRTFVFYIDREYQNITKLPKNDFPPPNDYNSIPTNPVSFPVILRSTPPPTQTRCATYYDSTSDDISSDHSRDHAIYLRSDDTSHHSSVPANHHGAEYAGPRSTVLASHHSAKHASLHSTVLASHQSAEHASPHSSVLASHHSAEHASPHSTALTSHHSAVHASPHSTALASHHSAELASPHSTVLASHHSAEHASPHSTVLASHHSAEHPSPHSTVLDSHHSTEHASHHSAEDDSNHRDYQANHHCTDQASQHNACHVSLHGAEHTSKLSADQAGHHRAATAHQPSDIGEDRADHLFPEKSLWVEGSHDSPNRVCSSIPSTAVPSAPIDDTLDQTGVSDVQHSGSDTPVQLVSLECQSVSSHCQAHGSTRGGEGRCWHDIQHSPLSLIKTHHHPCSCTQ